MQYNRVRLYLLRQFERRIFMLQACIGKLNASRARLRRLILFTSIICLTASCAASRDPSAARPRANEPPYPVILAANAERRDQALAGWAALAHDQNLRNEPPPTLQPVTATISELPASDAPVRLPLVEIRDEAGQIQEASQEESRRESLRRFITGAGALLGVTPQNLSLVERKDDADGTRRARYQQQPFPYPLRAGFGLLEIAFTDDRRVLSLSSTAIPDTERLSRALALVRPQQLTAEQAIERLRGRAFTFSGINSPPTYTIAPDDPIIPRELVIYPIRPSNDASALELHLAWEMAVGKGTTPFLVYLDAVRGEIIAATTQAVQSEKKQPESKQ
jgi:hypothetical protein